MAPPSSFSSPSHPHQLPSSLLLLDPLCCQEEDPSLWEDEEYADHPAAEQMHGGEEEAEEGSGKMAALGWEGEELPHLLSKESEARLAAGLDYSDAAPFLSSARREAVGWVLRASARHGFTAQTALLSADYLDRFLSSAHHRQQLPWMAQLSAVACLSLAAKVEETHVPLLLDLQVEETRYVFEAKTIQRMELLVLSTLGWRMGSVTPLSFVDHFVRRMGAPSASPFSGENNKNGEPHLHLHWDFQARCQSVLLSLVADSRWVQFLPSVLAAATMLHALGQLDLQSNASTSTTLENQLLALLNLTKEQVRGCSEFILETLGGGGGGGNGGLGNGEKNKRKYSYNFSPSPPPSPRGVLGSLFSCDSSNDSWAAAAASSSEPPRPLKRPNSMVMVGNSGDEGRPQLLRSGVFV